VEKGVGKWRKVDKGGEERGTVIKGRCMHSADGNVAWLAVAGPWRGRGGAVAGPGRAEAGRGGARQAPLKWCRRLCQQ